MWFVSPDSTNNSDDTAARNINSKYLWVVAAIVSELWFGFSLTSHGRTEGERHWKIEGKKNRIVLRGFRCACPVRVRNRTWPGTKYGSALILLFYFKIIRIIFTKKNLSVIDNIMKFNPNYFQQVLYIFNNNMIKFLKF